MLLALALLRGLAPALAAAGWHWTYDGPHGQERWAEGFPACGGRAQSPIDIETRRAQPEPALPPLQLRSAAAAAGPWELSNNGHTVVLALPRALTLHGLPGAFAAAQLHLHWGGSEHLVDGRAAAGELHVVLFDAERFGGAGDALHHAGGLAVLAALLEPGPEPNGAYENVLRHLDSVRYAGQSTSIPAFDVRQLLPARLDLYYRYNGSLTTPPCAQGVIWSVFREPVRVGSAQLARLRGALFATEPAEATPQPLLRNVRAPQSLHERPVLASAPTGPTGYGAGEVVAIVLGAGAGCAGLVLAGYFVAKRMR